MAFIPNFAGKPTTNVRNERRRQDDKKRMAYRRAIEDYREAQALKAQLGDFPELMATHNDTLARPII